jgi:hypothetical protein
MESILCKKCKLKNDAALDYCQLCGANLKGGRDSVPGHIFIIKVSKDNYMDVYLTWKKEGIYTINMVKLDSESGGIFAGFMNEIDRKQALETYKNEVFHLPIDKQFQIQGGLVIRYSDIAELREVKSPLGITAIELYDPHGKMIMGVGGSKKQKDDFTLQAEGHGFKIVKLKK